jgi:hypothetical protein
MSLEFHEKTDVPVQQQYDTCNACGCFSPFAKKPLSRAPNSKSIKFRAADSSANYFI